VKIPGAIRHIIGGPERTTALALGLMLAALLAPKVDLTRSVCDTIVVFDITQSMNVEDYAPDGVSVSRLAYARRAAHLALRDLPCGSRVGWGAFAEYRTLLLLAPVEVCANYGDLNAALDQIDGRMRWGNASEIAKGVFWGIRAARDLGSHPTLIFITDGQEAPPKDSAGTALFDDIQPGQIGGWLIGAGGDIPRPIPKMDPEGKPLGYWRADEVIQRDPDAFGDSLVPHHEHLSELHQAHLLALARQVHFDYARLLTEQSLSAAMLDRRYARRRPVPIDLAWLPAALALFLLVLRFRPDPHLTRTR
jgi:mxaL protein